MELTERVEQLEKELKALRPDLHFPSTATLGQRLRWLEIVLEEMRARDNHGVYAETLTEEKLRELLRHTVYIKNDRITLHNLTADPGSCVAGDMWFRSDLGKAKLAVDTVVANAKTVPATPTLSQDLAATALTATTADAASSCYLKAVNLAAGAEGVLATITQSFAAGSMAVGVAYAFLRAYNIADCTLRLYMGGVLMAESSAIPAGCVWTNEIVIATKALSGSQTCENRVYSPNAGHVDLPGYYTGYLVSAAIAVGSIKA